MKRTELKRRTPLARGPAPERRTRIKAPNAKRRGSRFPKRGDPAYCAWIRTLPCLLGDVRPIEGVRVECSGRVECAHVKSRGAGGDDRANGDAYPEKVNALDNLHLRLKNYADTGNAEFLMDAANFVMIEFMHSSHPTAFFQGTDADQSPVRIERCSGEAVHFPDRDTLA